MDRSLIRAECVSVRNTALSCVRRRFQTGKVQSTQGLSAAMERLDRLIRDDPSLRPDGYWAYYEKRPGTPWTAEEVLASVGQVESLSEVTG